MICTVDVVRALPRRTLYQLQTIPITLRQKAGLYSALEGIDSKQLNKYFCPRQLPRRSVQSAYPKKQHYRFWDHCRQYRV